MKARAGHLVPGRAARAGLPAAIAALVLALPATAAPPVDAPVRVAAPGALHLAWAGGERTEIPLAPEVAIDHLVTWEDGWLAAGSEARHGLVLLAGRAGEAGGVARLEPPAAGGPRAAHPVPLAADGRLAGLAWLAGDDERSLAVRFAPAEADGAGGVSWGPTETVAPPGPGTQTALAGAVLADGSLLLAWSAFDGEDDEILWSRRTADGWSAPAQLSPPNAVPDVTPAVAASGDGALVAWSRYEDGQYRTVVAALRDGTWAAPAPAGPPGSVSPALRPTERGALLLYRDVRRRDWTAVEVTAEGRLGARARLAGPPEAAPAVLAVGPEGVTYLPGPGAEATTVSWHERRP